MYWIVCMIISSVTNPRIKYIRSLIHRQEREQSQLFFVEGIRIVAEAIQLHANIQTIVYAPMLLKSQFGMDLVRQQEQQGIFCLEVSADVFKSFSVKDGPQGLGAVVHQRWEPLANVQGDEGLCWVALDAAQDPGNIGTILRTSDAVGCAGLLLLGQCADPYDSGALRASMGAIFSQRLVKASFTEFIEWKREQGASVVGTSDKGSVNYRTAIYRGPLVLLMGSERAGLSQEQQAVCDTTVRIPMVGRSDSLNLAVATGVVLYEIFYQKAAHL
ncbi:MAG: RNA methyltransferase [Ktedonobacteraceae bacterium]